MRRLALIALLLLNLTALAAQAPQPTFSATVTLVTTDVIVRNDRGQFVGDLKKEDFEVLEDGKPQDITSFVLVHGGRQFNVTPQADTPRQVQEGFILPAARPVADEAGRVILIFVDDAHLEPLNTHHLRQLLKKITTTLVHEGDLVSLVTTGTSSVAVPLTYDRKAVEAAIERVTGTGLTFADYTSLSEGPSGPANIRQRSANAFATAYQQINDLERVRNKRKAIVWVSQGYDFDPFGKARRGTDSVFGGRYGAPSRDLINDSNPFFHAAAAFAPSDLARQLQEITLAANRANATIFSMDPRGLTGTTDAGAQIDADEWKDHLLKTNGSLRQLAENTGGFAALSSNDFEPALKQIDAETSDYYVLGYYSANRDQTKRVRELEVRVKRPDVKVFSRRFYSLKPTQPLPSRTSK